MCRRFNSAPKPPFRIEHEILGFWRLKRSVNSIHHKTSSLLRRLTLGGWLITGVAASFDHAALAAGPDTDKERWAFEPPRDCWLLPTGITEPHLSLRDPVLVHTCMAADNINRAMQLVKVRRIAEIMQQDHSSPLVELDSVPRNVDEGHILRVIAAVAPELR